MLDSGQTSEGQVWALHSSAHSSQLEPVEWRSSQSHDVNRGDKGHVQWPLEDGRSKVERNGQAGRRKTATAWWHRSQVKSMRLHLEKHNQQKIPNHLPC